jgi:hypothetical protein
LPEPWQGPKAHRGVLGFKNHPLLSRFTFFEVVAGGSNLRLALLESKKKKRFFFTRTFLC